MPAPPRAVLLDVMDTLVHDPFREVVPAVTGMSLDAYFAVKDRDTYLAFEEGRIDEDTWAREHYVDRRPFDGEAFRDALADGYRWLPGIPALLEDLRAHDVPLHALSNYGPFWQHVEARLGVSRWVPWTFVSARTGRRKPAEDTFLHAARELALPPEALLFVDDREKNCEGARAAGLRAVRFEGADALRRRLVDLGVLPTR